MGLGLGLGLGLGFGLGLGLGLGFRVREKLIATMVPKPKEVRYAHAQSHEGIARAGITWEICARYGEICARYGEMWARCGRGQASPG